VALLADGVEPSKLYPLDVDRALKKIEAIKPNINVWWSSGPQLALLLKDGEIDLELIWGSRLAAVLKVRGKVGYAYN
jgi:putative spermidine/putrescine transport system substrate-binding protein